MKKRAFPVKNSYSKDLAAEVFYNDNDQVVKAVNEHGTLVIDNVVYDGQKIVSVDCPNCGLTFKLCSDGTYERVNSDGSRQGNYKDLVLLPNGLLKFIAPNGRPHSFGNTPPLVSSRILSQHRCSSGQCYEQKSFDTFKRFWHCQEGQASPSSTQHISLHEACHAVMAIKRGLVVKELTIVATDEYRGRVLLAEVTDDYLAHLDTALAGFVLDQALRIADTGAAKDLLAAYICAVEVCAKGPEGWLDVMARIDFEFDYMTSPNLSLCIEDNPFEAKAEALVLERISAVLLDMSDITEQIVAVAACAYDKKTIAHEDIERIMNAPYAVLSETYEDEASQLAGALSDWQLAIRKVVSPTA